MRNGKENCRTAGGRQRETETERARKTAEFSTLRAETWGKKFCAEVKSYFNRKNCYMNGKGGSKG